ncbi:MAG: hypothetical protein ACI9VI_003537 [Candidatus Azotimanducaceae bacterium]|jgi:hypothetical protein
MHNEKISVQPPVVPQWAKLASDLNQASLAGRRHVPGQFESAIAQLDRYDAIDEGIGLEIDPYHLQDQLQQSSEPYAVRRMIERDLAEYMRDEVYPLYLDQSLMDAADKMLLCRCSGCAGVTGESRLLRTWDNKCSQSRLCPDEARTETQRIKRRYVPVIQEFGKQVGAKIHYMVLTLPNSELGNLRLDMKHIMDSFSTLIRQKKWEKIFKGENGCLTRLENPMGSNEKWNVHLNVIVMTKEYLNYGDFRKAWAKQCGHDDLQVDIQQINGSVESLNKSINELIKYIALHVGEKSEGKGRRSKAPGMTEWSPEAFYEWFRAGKKFRFTRTYGALYKTPKSPTQDLDLKNDVIWVAGFEFTQGRYIHRINHKRLGLILGDNSTATKSGEYPSSVEPVRSTSKSVQLNQ